MPKADLCHVKISPPCPDVDLTMSFLSGADPSVSYQLFRNRLVCSVNDTGSLVANVDEADRYYVRSQSGRRQIVSPSMKTSAAIKQEPIVECMWSYTRTRRN